MVRPAQHTNRTQTTRNVYLVDSEVSSLSSSGLLLDRRVLLALLVWVGNDWLLKPTFGRSPLGLITGKLSDVAGLVVLAAAFGALFAAAQKGRRLTPVSRVAALTMPSLALVMLKTSATIAATYSFALESITGFSHHVVVDPTDLVALVAILPAAQILANPRPLARHFANGKVKQAIAGFAVVMVAGASSFSETSYTHLENTTDNQLVVHDGHGAGGELGGPAKVLNEQTGEWETYSAEVAAGEQVTRLCSTSETAVCVRGVGEPERNRIEESTDGGETWQEVWHVDGRESWVRNLASSEGEIEVSDIAETSNGQIAVAVGYLLPVIRSADGSWSPTVADLRTFPVMVLLSLVSGAVAALSGVVGRRLTGHWLWFGPVAIGLATIWMTPFVFDLSPLGFAFVPAVGLAAVVGLAALAAIAVRSNIVTVALVPVLAVTAVATAVIPLILWASGIGTWPLALFAASSITSLFVLWLAFGRRLPTAKPPPSGGQPLVESAD